MSEKENKPTKEDVQQAETIDLRKPDVLDGLPDYLKLPKNYDKVRKALLETLSCPKSHSDPSEIAKCKRCTENMVNRRNLMTKFGFKSPAQYMQWQKVHEEIKKYTTPDDYERMLKS